MSKAEENVVLIDDKEVKVSELTNEQLYFTQQINDLQNKQARINFELDQVNASLSVFRNALLESYKKTVAESEEEEVAEKKEKVN
jgi:hypothetical protein